MGVFACAKKADPADPSTEAQALTTVESSEEMSEARTEESLSQAETSRSVLQTSEPSTEASQPVTEETEPSTEETESLTEETQPLTEVPEPPTEAPEPPTQAPEPPTQAPEPPTQAPEPPTEAPEPPTQAPEPPTQAPEPPTQAPEPPTQAPEPPTQAPEPPTQAPEPPTEAPQPPEIVSVWYTTGALNLRQGPDLNETVLLTIPENTKVDCLEEGPVWNRVIYDGTIGYVANGYLADEPLITFPGYGETAYNHVAYLDKHFPVRINGNGHSTEVKDACGAWIEKTMNGFGYTATVYAGAAPASGAPIKSYAFRKSCGVENAKLLVIGAHYDSRECHGAEDNATGVGMVLELAQHFASVPLPYDIDFCFWDGEELQGCAGSYIYVNNCPDTPRIALYINLDCLGAGDHLHAYGGDYKNGRLVRAEGYQKAMEIATRFGIPLRPVPAGLAEPEFKTPIRLYGSDQYYFAQIGLPYLYFEANAWVD
ncbi:MAG: M28 family peptidase, partial [Lachnospiraceae bacterium]|nr:M28 family peptidase [Lachnospiraceae bacterium]